MAQGRRYEVEVVARALHLDGGGTENGEIHWRDYKSAEKVIAALAAAGVLAGSKERT